MMAQVEITMLPCLLNFVRLPVGCQNIFCDESIDGFDAFMRGSW